jgi:hypothetical protein
MVRHVLKRLVSAGVCGLAVGVLAAFSAKAPQRTLDCLVATQWVVAHADHLPTEYSDVVALPLSVRRKVFSALPVDVRANLWRAHFAVFAAQHSLNDEQSEFVAEISANVEGAIKARDVYADSVMKAKGERLFGKRMAFELMANLGPVAPTAVKSDDVLPCECDANQGDQQDWCSIDNSSKCKVGGCIFDTWGCGLFWTWPCSGCCNGKCGYFEQ